MFRPIRDPFRNAKKRVMKHDMEYFDTTGIFRKYLKYSKNDEM